mmetsp:Transcript_66264/g.182957  ORF Transcript_66264/g.182957 Transcript_66264/m.182957 type:complete len:322 (-) Transcript_66264:145-1110(-)
MACVCVYVCACACVRERGSAAHLLVPVPPVHLKAQRRNARVARAYGAWDNRGPHARDDVGRPDQLVFVDQVARLQQALVLQNPVLDPGVLESGLVELGELRVGEERQDARRSLEDVRRGVRLVAVQVGAVVAHIDVGALRLGAVARYAANLPEGLQESPTAGVLREFDLLRPVELCRDELDHRQRVLIVDVRVPEHEVVQRDTHLHDAVLAWLHLLGLDRTPLPRAAKEAAAGPVEERHLRGELELVAVRLHAIEQLAVDRPVLDLPQRHSERRGRVAALLGLRLGHRELDAPARELRPFSDQVPLASDAVAQPLLLSRRQ